MPIYRLSDITFTDQDDIVPLSGKAILRNYSPLIVNTLAGNDIINADNEIVDKDTYYYPGAFPNISAFSNQGTTLNTAEGNDEITGVVSQKAEDWVWNHYGILNELGGNYNLEGRIDTGDGNDKIFGIIQPGINGDGIYNNKSTIDTGDGDDKIIGISHTHMGINNGNGFINTGNGKDTITGIGVTWGIRNYSATFNTNDGDDIITGNSKNYYGIENTKFIYTGDGNDKITGTGGSIGINNKGIIESGNGSDIITGTSTTERGYGIYNGGSINTGNGDDSIIANGGIHNNGGAINMGDGNDSIISNGGFQSASNSSGAWFLGEGDDYIKGFGSGDFYGGNGNDTLELTPGTYTVGIWGEGGESPIFTKGDQLMITSEFEKLKAGGIIYDFTSLTAGQIIVVA